MLGVRIAHDPPKQQQEVTVKKRVDPVENDLRVVAEWLETTVDNVFVDVRQEPIAAFSDHIEELYGDYDESGVDFKRSYYIAKLIEHGAEIAPVYVAAGDPDLLVIKGCHRLIAFWILGMKFVPVAYAARKRG